MQAILALDTATQACSAALWIDGKILSRYVLAPQRHGELILPMCDALLQEAKIKLSELSALAFGRGPGSFTGTRIAAGVVQGLAFAHDLPVISVSSLQCIAQKIHEKYDDDGVNIHPVIDAGSDKIYTGEFQWDSTDQLMKLIGEEGLIHKNQPKNQPQEQFFPDAKYLLNMALYEWRHKNILRPEHAAPVYLGGYF